MSVAQAETKRKAWRMESPCADCPFNEDGPGLHLRKSLQPGRWRSILNDLRRDGMFHCHNTTGEDDEGEVSTDGALLCAGALGWQEEHLGYWGQYARICERLEALK